MTTWLSMSMQRYMWSIPSHHYQPTYALFGSAESFHWQDYSKKVSMRRLRSKTWGEGETISCEGWRNTRVNKRPVRVVMSKAGYWRHVRRAENDHGRSSNHAMRLLRSLTRKANFQGSCLTKSCKGCLRPLLNPWRSGQEAHHAMRRPCSLKGDANCNDWVATKKAGKHLMASGTATEDDSTRRS